jgi:guanylate kinase
MAVIVLTGKCASGKNAIASALEDKGYKIITTVTSRPMRVGEVNLVDYTFVTKEQFEDMIKDDKFIEYRAYNTLVAGIPDVWYYGSVKTELSDKYDYCIVLTPDGARKSKEYYGNDCFSVYVDVPDDIREKRAMSRGSFDRTEWERRLETDNTDFSPENISDIDCTIDNTGTLDAAVSLIVRRFEHAKKKSSAAI